MGAVTTARCNRVFKEFYGRLVAAGKPKKAVLTERIRKLPVILNSILRRRVAWQPSPVCVEPSVLRGVI